MTRARPRLRSLSVSGLVTSALKFCCVSLNFVVFWFAFVYQKILLCFGKYCCASGNFLVFWKRLLCSQIGCCVLKKIVVFWKRLLCSEKDCCVVQKIVVFFKRLLCFRTEIELCFAPMGHRILPQRKKQRYREGKI